MERNYFCRRSDNRRRKYGRDFAISRILRLPRGGSVPAGILGKIWRARPLERHERTCRFSGPHFPDGYADEQHGMPSSERAIGWRAVHGGSLLAGHEASRPDWCPFLLSRSGFTGLQRFAATWTGDNRSSWEHLKLANFQCQRLAASGISFAGADAGGFMGHPLSFAAGWTASFHGFFRTPRRNDCGKNRGKRPSASSGKTIPAWDAP